MQVWLVEHRQVYNHEYSTCVMYAASSRQLAFDYCKANLVELNRHSHNNSWYAIYGMNVDQEFGMPDPRLAFVDRLGHLSTKFQPATAPHLLEEWETTL